MTGYKIRRVPWTCRWGRFGVAVEDLGSTSRVDDVFWACHNPVRGPEFESRSAPNVRAVRSGRWLLDCTSSPWQNCPTG